MWIALTLLGCEQVEPSGNPFQPAPNQRAGANPVAALPDFMAEPEQEPFKLKSDGSMTEVVADPAQATDEPPSAPTDLDQLGVDPPEEASPEDTADPLAEDGTEETTEPPTNLEAASVVPQQMITSGWPVRLVKTIPDAEPPRAVLGLPDGTEIVVKPGSMVPEEQLVVVAIGPDKVHVSQVTPNGDHAAINSFTLESMY